MFSFRKMHEIARRNWCNKGPTYATLTADAREIANSALKMLPFFQCLWCRLLIAHRKTVTSGIQWQYKQHLAEACAWIHPFGTKDIFGSVDSNFCCHHPAERTRTSQLLCLFCFAVQYLNTYSHVQYKGWSKQIKIQKRFHTTCHRYRKNAGLRVQAC